MKINKMLWSVLCASILQLISQPTNAGFVDPRLEAWNSAPVKNGLTAETREVIVFLNAPRFQDRSGLFKSQAIAFERSDSLAYIQDHANRLSRNSDQKFQNLTLPKTEILWASRAFVTQATRTDVNRMARDSSVEAVIENSIVTLEEPIRATSKNMTNEEDYTYGLQIVHAPQAWDMNLSGKDVIVGVIDTGVDEKHPDLEGKILLQKDFTSDNDNVDYHGHGTHVAGTIAGGNASGRHIGVAPNAKIIMAKVFNSKGQADTATLLKAMEFMIDPDGDPLTNDAPRIVSNSWGAPTQFFYGFRNIVQNWRRFEIFPSFAAGNSGSFYFTVNAPGSYPFSYAVGAVDEEMNITSFSSRGPGLKSSWPFFYRKPEISAPGHNVYSSLPGGQYDYYSGTSMATPHLSGVVALMLQANPDLKIAEIEEFLNGTAVDRGSSGRDIKYGFGVVQADRAIERALAQKSNSHSRFVDSDPSQWAWETP